MSDDKNIDPSILAGNPQGVGSTGKSGGFTLRPAVTGIATVNRRVLYVVGGGLTVIALVAVATFNQAGSSATNAAKDAISHQDDAQKTQPAGRGALWYINEPDSYASIVGASAPTATASGAASASSDQRVPDLTGQAVSPLTAATAPKSSAPALGQNGALRPGAAAQAQTPQQAQQAAMEAQMAQNARMKAQQDLDAALSGKLDIEGFTKPTATPALPPASGAPAGSTNSFSPPVLGNAQQQDDQNKQERKDQFMSAARMKVDTDYNLAIKTPQRSPYELKGGSIIPSAMVSGLDSDLPGQITARVRENVYDSRTHSHILIPQGATIIGLYDAHVAYGQERALVVWNRIIFPNGDSYDLHGMPGADQAGYAGFYDSVDNHYIKIFGSAAVIAVLGAGVALTQPNNGNSTTNTPSVTETLGASLGQQIGQTGMAITQKNLNIQPTLRIPPGYRFNIMVTSDCVLEPVDQ